MFRWYVSAGDAHRAPSIGSLSGLTCTPPGRLAAIPGDTSKRGLSPESRTGGPFGDGRLLVALPPGTGTPAERRRWPRKSVGHVRSTVSRNPVCRSSPAIGRICPGGNETTVSHPGAAANIQNILQKSDESIVLYAPEDRSTRVPLRVPPHPGDRRGHDRNLFQRVSPGRRRYHRSLTRSRPTGVTVFETPVPSRVDAAGGRGRWSGGRLPTL